MTKTRLEQEFERIHKALETLQNTTQSVLTGYLGILIKEYAEVMSVETDELFDAPKATRLSSRMVQLEDLIEMKAKGVF